MVSRLDHTRLHCSIRSGLEMGPDANGAMAQPECRRSCIIFGRGFCFFHGGRNKGSEGECENTAAEAAAVRADTRARTEDDRPGARVHEASHPGARNPHAAMQSRVHVL